MMTEVTCALIKRGDEILITQRGETMTNPLEWEFPGGKMCPGESPEKCLRRELKEELNIAVSVDRLLPSVIHDYGSYTIKLIPFICSITSGEIRLTEHKDAHWLKKSDLGKYSLSAADRKIIEQLNGLWR